MIQKFRRNAKITNIDKFEVLKTATDAKVSQANKRIPGLQTTFTTKTICDANVM